MAGQIYSRLLLVSCSSEILNLFNLKFQKIHIEFLPHLDCLDSGIRRFPSGMYLLKVNNRNTRARCEICSKLTIKIPERRHWYLYC